MPAVCAHARTCPGGACPPGPGQTVTATCAVTPDCSAAPRVQVLQAWEDEGIDSKGLRRRLLGIGLSVVGLAAFQLLTDILAAYCSSTTATIFENSSFFGAGFLAIAFQTLYYYFAIGAAFDTFRLGGVIGGAAAQGASAETLYAAIEQLAGEQSGIALIDKAQAAVSTTKVVLALNSVRRAVKVREAVLCTPGVASQLLNPCQF